jgi:hypothetical protein
MRRRHVLVLFRHRLFGEAIARLLREQEELHVTALPAEEVCPEQLRDIHADAIVVEDERAASEFTALLDAAPALTVVVGPEANVAEVYERHEVIEATASEIVARILAGPHERRPITARRSGREADA